ncbi:MAG: hypothetical protein CMK07_04980 [Ponticaulis sp.]|nr:hypothetical protein [Ponticaulis sp.]
MKQISGLSTGDSVRMKKPASILSRAGLILKTQLPRRIFEMTESLIPRLITLRQFLRPKKELRNAIRMDQEYTK